MPRRQPRRTLFAELEELLRAPGPYLSIYCNTLDDPLPVSVRLGAWLKDEHLRTDDDADDPTSPAPLGPAELAAIDDLLDPATDERDNDAGMLAALVAADGTSIIRRFPDPPTVDVFDRGPLPRLGPIMEAEQTIAHQVVVAIEGPDQVRVAVIPRHGDPTSDVLTMNPESDVAGLVEAVVRSTDTRLVLLAAPSDQLSALEHEIRPRLAVETAFVGVADDDPDTSIAGDLTRWEADRSARRTVDLLRIWRFDRSHGNAADGLVETVEAMAEGRVGLLLLHDDPDDQRTLWFGAEATRLALDLEHAQPATSGEGLQPARQTDVLIRSALGQSCPVVLVPDLPDDRLRDGVGAILVADPAERQALLDLIDP